MSSSADKPRRRQIDEIVEPRRRPAERLVTRRAVADHAVGGVDCFVECGAGEPGNGHPQDRRDDAVGEILREAFDRRAGDAGFVERVGIAADDVRYCGAAGGDAVRLERGGDVGDVPVQAALRDQGAGEERRGEDAERQAKQLMLRSTNAIDPTMTRRINDRDDARGAPPIWFAVSRLSASVERADQAADPGHRMADRAQQALRITDRRARSAWPKVRARRT